MISINIGEFAKDNDCFGDWDTEYQCYEINEDKLLDLLEEKIGKSSGGFVVEHHVTDLFPERWFDLVLVLRCDNTILFDRLSKRGYEGKKLEDNIQAEIFQTVLDEAKESYREELVVELQSNKEDDLGSNLERIKQWIEQWSQDRGKVREGKRKAVGEIMNE